MTALLDECSPAFPQSAGRHNELSSNLFNIVRMESAREVIADWMRAVMADKGWTAADWSKETEKNGPQVAASTITRFLANLKDQKKAPTPKVGTIERLAFAANYPMPMEWRGGREPKAINTDLLSAVISVFLEELRDQNIDLTADRTADLICYVYEHFADESLHAAPDPAMIKSQIFKSALENKFK